MHVVFCYSFVFSLFKNIIFNDLFKISPHGIPINEPKIKRRVFVSKSLRYVIRFKDNAMSNNMNKWKNENLIFIKGNKSKTINKLE